MVRTKTPSHFPHQFKETFSFKPALMRLAGEKQECQDQDTNNGRSGDKFLSISLNSPLTTPHSQPRFHDINLSHNVFGSVRNTQNCLSWNYFPSDMVLDKIKHPLTLGSSLSTTGFVHCSVIVWLVFPAYVLRNRTSSSLTVCCFCTVAWKMHSLSHVPLVSCFSLFVSWSLVGKGGWRL